MSLFGFSSHVFGWLPLFLHNPRIVQHIFVHGKPPVQPFTVSRFIVSSHGFAKSQGPIQLKEETISLCHPEQSEGYLCGERSVWDINLVTTPDCVHRRPTSDP